MFVDIQTGHSNLREILPRDVVEIGSFRVEAIRVTHSIVDALGYAIRTAIKEMHRGGVNVDAAPQGGQLGAEADAAGADEAVAPPVERPARMGHGQLAGRTSTNRWVNFDAPEALIGRFVDVDVTESLNNSMRGRLRTDRDLAA